MDVTNECTERSRWTPPSKNLLHQQERFDAFLHEFNNERPHEALRMKCPGQVYKKSKRALPVKLPEPDYKEHDDIVRVTKNGYLLLGKNLVYVSDALSYMLVGI